MEKEDTEKVEDGEYEVIEEIVEEVEEDDSILAKPKPYKKANPETDKRKKPRSPAQIKAFEKARAKREENRIARKKLKEQEQEQKKKEMENKIVKTAVRVKKRQAIKEKLIEEVISSDSDEEPEIQAVKKYMKKKQQKKKVTMEKPPETIGGKGVTPPKQVKEEKPKIQLIFR